MDDAAELDDAPADAPLPADLLSDRRRVEAALAELPEGDRALVVLRFRNGLEYAELAEAFGLREGTVRMRMSRALVRMRAALEAREGRARASLGEVAAPARAPFAARPGAPPPPAAAPAGHRGSPPAGFGGPPPAPRPARAGAVPRATGPLGPLALALAGFDEAPEYEARLAALLRSTFG